MPSGAEVLSDGSIRRQKALGMSRRFKPLHAILALACGAMRVLTAVVEIAAPAVFDSGQDLALRRAIALELIRDDDPRDIPQALEQLAKKLLRRVLIPPAVDQDIEDIVVLVHRPPQVMPLTMDREKHLIQVPFVAWLGTSMFQPIRVVLPKLQTPLPDGLMGDIDPAFAQQFLHITIAQREAVIEPDPMADDLAEKAVILVVFGISGWRHVWLPIGVCEWFLRVHHRSEYLTGQEARST